MARCKIFVSFHLTPTIPLRLSYAEYVLEDDNKVENGDEEENGKEVEDNTGVQNEVQNESGSDLEGDMEEGNSEDENSEDDGGTSKARG